MCALTYTSVFVVAFLVALSAASLLPPPSVSAGQTTSMSVTGLSLINADSDQPIASFDPLSDRAALDLATLPTRNLSIRANTAPTKVGSVQFTLDGQLIKTENTAPYAIAGDRNSGADYRAWTPALGNHTLTVTPYSGRNASGTAGASLTINFTFTDGAPAPTATPVPSGSRTNGKIVFKGNHDIYTTNADGTGQARLTTEGDNNDPVWSPDGKQIAFVRNDRIWVMNADGSGQRRLTSGTTLERSPSWTPSGNIAFRQTDRLVTRNPDGSGEASIALTGESANGTNFVWAPNGSSIAFQHQRSVCGDLGCAYYYTIWVMNTDGSNQRQITDGEGDGRDVEPRWSPDSARISFLRYFSDNDGLYVVNADGSGLTRLTGDDGSRDAAWSPDGARIVFSRDLQIFTMRPDGSDVQQINNPAIGTVSYDQQELSPDWQPRVGPQPTPTPTSGDTTPPAVPTNLRASGVYGKAQVSWDATTDTGGSGFAQYELWRSINGTNGGFSLRAVTTGTNFTDTQTLGGEYCYALVAVDKAGNRSALSTKVCAILR
jgi:dipeptidyl aminopeptidase/acylaminoacyl peptidase